MRVGSLVRIVTSTDPRDLNKLAIVVVKGTWSVDVHIIDSNSSWQPRFAIEELEVLCE
tara:strand:- start:363 stop:536 length:174 start_codon:yes stop_codon:yes gene_type:complete